MQKIKDVMSYKLTKDMMARTTPGSKTQPNEALTIQEIFRRTQLGLPVNVRERRPIFTMDERSVDFDAVDLSKVPDMDLTEKSELLEQTRERVKETTAKVKSEQDRAAAEKKKAAAEEFRKMQSEYLKEQKAQKGSQDDAGATKGKKPAD